MATPNPIQPLTPEKKVQWNSFIDFMRQKGYAGSDALDDRNTRLGEGLLNQFNKLNPNSQINYGDIASVQAELQNYRQTLVNQWKANPKIADAKSADEIMPGISKVDGWLGSKTSSYKFPPAHFTNPDGSVANFGVQTDLYDKFIAAKKAAADKLKEK